MVIMAQSAANWHNMHSQSHTYINSYILQLLCAKHQFSYYYYSISLIRISIITLITEVGIKVLFSRYLREGKQTGVPGEKP